MIRLEGISRTFDLGGRPVHALVDVDETIGAGEHVAIIGPSGSGKSTLLNLLGCLDRPTPAATARGSRRGGALESELDAVRRDRIGFVFQAFHLVSRLSAIENVELPMLFAGTGRAERRERAMAALEAVGLADRADHRPDQLSGGERQRTALARATVIEPAILLADEPTGNLDTASGYQVLDLLDRMNDRGLTLVVVTHDPYVARRADRLLVLVDGRIVRRIAAERVHSLEELFLPPEEVAAPMRPADLLTFSWRALSRHPLRSALSLLGVGVGVTAVVLLTALGEGARRYVVDQFSAIGSNLLIVVPGKGGDHRRHARRRRRAQRPHPGRRRGGRPARGVGPPGGAGGGRHRERLPRRPEPRGGGHRHHRRLRPGAQARGRRRPLPARGRARPGPPVAVIGSAVARELFPAESALGGVVRIGDWRFRVIGVLGAKGTQLGVDLDEVVLIPVGPAMRMLNRTSLFRLLIEVAPGADLDAVRRAGDRPARRAPRRGGRDGDDPGLGDLGPSGILGALTLAVAAIAAISLVVAGIGILNVMLVSVSERTGEVGLLRALGAARRQVLAVFLVEAAILSSVGGAAGLGAGYGLARLLARIYPALPAAPPVWAVWASLATAVGVGLTFGLLPARRAARLDPVEALRG